MLDRPEVARAIATKGQYGYVKDGPICHVPTSMCPLIAPIELGVYQPPV